MDGFADRLQRLEGVVHALQQQNITVARRLRWWRRLACSLALLTMFSLPLTLGAAQDERRGGKLGDDHKETLKGLLQRFLAIERKLEHVSSVIGPEGFPELVITGANLRIVNGLGRTDCGAEDNPVDNCPNGLGNLIVGYNEIPSFDAIIRTGSHNVVIGSEHNFSSFGGLVVGLSNTIAGRFSSVTGGSRNVAVGDFSSVSGGQGSVEGGFAIGMFSSISGGLNNIASGDFSSVCGGLSNEASGAASVVTGGAENLASGDTASVTAGGGNTASGVGSSVTAGAVNVASGDGASVTGGQDNIASGPFASVSGGEVNRAAGTFASVSGGFNRAAVGDYDWAAGGLFQNQ
jgi:hypothetical protein